MTACIFLLFIALMCIGSKLEDIRETTQTELRAIRKTIENLKDD